ncbi:hypothetical protein L1887_35275 [Cichorium endivia]|nr:hypothetical protein L1887_35275 [Cichorium endivia]
MEESSTTSSSSMSPSLAPVLPNVSVFLPLHLESLLDSVPEDEELFSKHFFGRKKRNTQEKSTSSHRSLIFIYPTQNSCHFHKLKAIEIALFAAHGYAFRSISYHPI